MRRAAVVAAAAGVLATLGAPPAQAVEAETQLIGKRTVAPDTQRYTYRHGPLFSTAGQSLILLSVSMDKPLGPGYMTRFAGTMVRADGSTPPTEEVHNHHSAITTFSRFDENYPPATTDFSTEHRKWPQLPDRIFAYGEDRTILRFPSGYGYPMSPDEAWVLNYMIHNGTSRTEVVYLQWEIDYVAADSDAGRATQPLKTLWMDVENGSLYPVFDARRGAGGDDGLFTYPDEAEPDPYGDGPRLNEWRVPHDLTLRHGWGHVHPGGLHTDLSVRRDGREVTLFRSEARYFDPNGPVSWDFAMTDTKPGWSVALKEGDVLRITGTYDTERASWYENMALMGLFYTDGADGPDPFADPPEILGEPTHGPLPENSNHGGDDLGAPDPTALPGTTAFGNTVGIAAFTYEPGDYFRSPRIPEVEPGERVRFFNADGPAQIFHSVTSCKPPCNRSTGVSYPIADGDVQFDSGTLGVGPPSMTNANQRLEWETPPDLDPGTYTYFCRVHPFMRGAFRVRAPSG